MKAEKDSIQMGQKDLEGVVAHLMKIQEACHGLQLFAEEKGGIPFLERNVDRIRAPLHLLMGMSEVLELMKEQ